jgi:hypothetical protein
MTVAENDKQEAPAAKEAPRQDHYPMFVARTDASKRRWDLSMAVAAREMGKDATPAQVRQMAVTLFQSVIPTG